MILCKAAHAKAIDKVMFPGIQGGPLMHVIAAKAVALKEALSPDFAAYQRAVLANARTLATALKSRGYHIVTGGTDTHLFLVDLRSKALTGKDAEAFLDAAGITLNKNAVPFDDKPPAITSGIRIGTPSVTTRGMGAAEMEQIAAMIDRVLTKGSDPAVIIETNAAVQRLCERFPVYRGR
jgi:glycine hydroxymethyltransferase